MRGVKGAVSARGQRATGVFFPRPGSRTSDLSGLIPEDIIIRIRESTDIVGLVSRYLSLKKAGASFKALCPFHKEKTPSFIVTPSRQTFKCFGCGKGGNVFHFVMAMDRVSFPEAVRTLAREAAIDVPEPREPTVEERAERDERSLLYEANRRAADFFARTLAGPGGKAARAYVESRGISGEMVEQCRLGYSPDGWDALINSAAAAGVSADLLCKAGLAIRRDDGSCYDRFRNRLMFPIFDTQDRVVGFGARAMGDDEVKYLNTPETPVFNKGRNLYGLNWARKPIVDGKRVAVVEGYTDVIMAHQHGCTAVVATLGTALTRDHIHVLRRFAERIDVVFDSDAAGQQAAERSIELFLAEGAGDFLAAGFDVRIATIESGKDPCDLIAEQGPAAFTATLDAACDVITQKIRIASARHDVDAIDGKTKAVDEILALVSVMPNAVGRQLAADDAIRKLSHAFGVEDRSLRARLAQLEQRTRRRTRPADDEPRAPRATDPAELGALEAALLDPDFAEEAFGALGPEDFADEALRFLFEIMQDVHASDGSVHGEQLLNRLEDPELAALVSGLLDREVEHSGLDCLRVLMRRRVERAIQAVGRRLEEAKAAGDEDGVSELISEHMRLQREVLAL